jgi:hypothetical protein
MITTRADIQSRIRIIRDELETRHKYGTVKIANTDGTPVSVEKLQKELYSLIYKLSKLE